jgi:hypothetical protein
MNKFQNAKIYKIIDNTSDLIYIGSTCKTLNQRLKQHEYNFKCFKLGKTNNVTSFKILDNNDYKIELIKLYPCQNKQELCIEEGRIIKESKTNGLNIVNKNIAGLTKKESDAQYYKNNKNKINQKNNCVCGGKYTNSHKVEHEKSKKHCKFIKNQTINIAGNNYNININITVNNIDDLENLELDFLKAINK